MNQKLALVCCLLTACLGFILAPSMPAVASPLPQIVSNEWRVTVALTNPATFYRMLK